MIIVSDASPLIFLAKAERIELVPSLFPGTVLVPSGVSEELLGPGVPPAEARALTQFLDRHAVVDVPDPGQFATAMSRADSEVLTLAIDRRADWLLSDERLLRAMAAAEGIRPIGTLGIFLRALRAGIVTADDVRDTVSVLIREHCFRISIEVYAAFLAEIGG